MSIMHKRTENKAQQGIRGGYLRPKTMCFLHAPLHMVFVTGNFKTWVHLVAFYSTRFSNFPVMETMPNKPRRKP
eukprot:338725-Pelagomonas_calceolata.AAC.1